MLLKPTCEKCLQWHIHGLVWAHRFLRSKNRKISWGDGVLGWSSRENVLCLDSESLCNMLKFPWIDNFKSKNVWKTSKLVTIYKTHKRRQLKIRSKNRWSHNVLTVLIAFRKKKQRYGKVKFFKKFRYNCNKGFV